MLITVFRLLAEDFMKNRSRNVPMEIAATELQIVKHEAARGLETSGG